MSPGDEPTSPGYHPYQARPRYVAITPARRAGCCYVTWLSTLPRYLVITATTLPGYHPYQARSLLSAGFARELKPDAEERRRLSALVQAPPTLRLREEERLSK